MRIIAPWPKGLSPNDRLTRYAKARAVKAYRAQIGWLAIEAGAKRMSGPLSVTVTFCPIGRGPNPDRDNCIAAFKAGQDGLADALGINDRDMMPTYAMGERCKSGAIIIDIIEAEE